MLARRVPVRTVAGASGDLTLRCRSHGRPDRRSVRARARVPDGVRRDDPVGGAADLHRARRGGPAVTPAPEPVDRGGPDADAADHAAPDRHGKPPAIRPRRPVPPDRVATRVRIADLDIDLPVVKGNPAIRLRRGDVPGRSLCSRASARPRTSTRTPRGDVPAAAQDQGPRPARVVVEVWTSDDWLFRYEIVAVRRDQPYDGSTTRSREERAALAADVARAGTRFRLHPGHRQRHRRGRPTTRPPTRRPTGRLRLMPGRPA